MKQNDPSPTSPSVDGLPPGLFPADFGGAPPRYPNGSFVSPNELAKRAAGNHCY